ncbi:rho GTPase-activating protein 17-like [Octopus bimaculoides]|uniref:rho GTPase-activating protein 17-like n=1 Tax=Octopus bimaculoides TaxID=37653 RepID=UPI0022E8B412|nr:rho GTPase-activating protein 17-like [Octopus bimaculoides]
MVLKLLLPIWVMMFVFHPLPPAGDQEDLIPAFSEDGAYSSTFSASTEDQQYRQLYYPAEDYRSVDTQVSVAPGGHLTGAVGTNIKITHSAATNVAANSNYFKQTSLAPIREESGSVSVGSLTATQSHSINNAPGVQLQAPLPSQQQDMQAPPQIQQQNIRQQQLQKQQQQQRRDKAFV